MVRDLWAPCSPGPLERQLGAKLFTFFSFPFSPQPFSEQAFICPRCSCLCSDLILPIYPPIPVYYVPFLFGSRGSVELPRLILSVLG